MGIVSELTWTALAWYYFNILAITGILFFWLAIMWKRASQTIINTSERPYKPDNTLMRWTFYLVVFGIMFFFTRQWGDDIWKASQEGYEAVRGYFG